MGLGKKVGSVVGKPRVLDGGTLIVFLLLATGVMWGLLFGSSQVGVCKIVCASVLSHRESSKMGKRGRGSKWQIKIVSDSSVRNSFGA